MGNSSESGAATAQSAAALRTELIRDAAGRLIEKRTASHHCHYRYDALDRLLEARKFALESIEPLSKPEQTKPQQHPWPATLPEQVRAVAAVLAASPAPLSLPAIEARFKGRGPWKKGLPTLLQTLEALGRAQAVATGGEVAWRG